MASKPTTTTTTPAPKLSQQQQATLDEIKSKLGGSGTKSAIGVPNGYQAQSPNGTDRKDEYKDYIGPVGPQDLKSASTPRERQDKYRDFMGPVGPQQLKPAAPMYFDGAQYQPSSMSSPDILALQLRLKAAGILTQPYHPGEWDPVSAQSYEMAMGFANRAGTDVDSVINSWTNNPMPIDPNDQNGVVLTVKSPEEIKNLLQSTAAKVIGRSLSDAETTALVSGYQQLDRTAQEQDAAAKQLALNNPNARPQVIEAPDVGSYAEDQLRTKFKGEAQYQTANTRMNEFYGILGVGGGQLG